MPWHLSDSCFSGCDTTSRIHSVGKPAVLEKYRKSNEFQKLTTIFLNPSANKGDIIDAGEQLMLSITGATKKEKTMDEKWLLQQAWREVYCQTWVTWTHLRCHCKTLRKGLWHCSKLVRKWFTTWTMRMENVELDVPTCVNDKTSHTTWTSEDNQMWL